MKFLPHETCFIFDEIQDCPQARTALKFLSIDGQYDVLCTGSLLGVLGCVSQVASIPVGYEEIVDMYPMDFEEFLWANGIFDDVLSYLQECYQTETPVDLAIHNRMRELLLQYTVVGGMPEVVDEFVKTHNMERVWRVQQRIVRDYEDDIVKYAATEDKSLIKECFLSIPQH